MLGGVAALAPKPEKVLVLVSKPLKAVGAVVPKP